ncbi:MAG: dephospho-CoA kinase [Actinomycetota bacterium]
MFKTIKPLEVSIFIIGIVGRIGSGKTTAASILEKKIKSSVIIDVDSLAKEIYEADEDILKNIRAVFGDEVFTGEGLNYSALADRVFNDSAELKKLNRLMFPLIRNEVRNQLKENQEKKFLLLDAAVLFNCKLDVLCDYILWVNASKSTRKKYLLSKGIAEEEAEMKIRGQKIRINRSLVDFKIDNNGDKEKLESLCERAVRDILSRVGERNDKQV